MKSAAEILMDELTQHQQKVVFETTNLRAYIIDAMEQYANGEVKAFKNDLKEWLKVNPKATGKQILEHFKL